MKNFMKIAITAAFAWALVLFAAGCSEESVAGENKAIVEVSVKTSEARSALPVVPAECSYVVTASKGSETKTAADVEPATGAYKLELTEGEWQVLVKGYSSEKEILYGSDSLKVSSSGRYYITVPVYFVKEGTGDVSLEMKVTGTDVAKLTVSGTSTALDGDYLPDSGVIKIEKTGIASGNYALNLMFYDSSNVLLLALRETVNVRQNMTTSTWFKNGSEKYLVSEGNTGKSSFVLTNEVIKEIVNTTIFVKSGATATPTGSYLAPYAKMQEAVNKAYSQNKINCTGYTIYVEGALSGEAAGFSVGSTGAEEFKLTVAGFGQGCTLTGDGSYNSIQFTGKTKENSCLFVKDVAFSGFTLNAANAQLQAGGKFVVKDGKVQLGSGDFILVSQALSDDSAVNLQLADCVIDSVVAKIKSGTGVTADYGLCAKFNVLNNSGIYCVVPADGACKLAFAGLETGISYQVPFYKAAISEVKEGTKLTGFTLAVKTKDGAAYTGQAVYYMAILQGGNACYSVASNSIAVPDWLKKGDYGVYGSVIIDGIEYQAESPADFKIE